MAEPLLPAAKPGGRPRTVDLHEMLCAIMSVLQGGTAWRNLPHDSSAWQTVERPLTTPINMVDTLPSVESGR
ncbi:transposase [Deinococcus rubellus]|uniref:transposase n=1 Tax=Deinococcus rubellus TaxID=1889240 RepID=UPI0035E44E9A